VESDWFLNKAAPPSAILNTVVELSWNLAILPVEVELVTTNESDEPELLPEIVVVPAVIFTVSEPSPILIVSASVFVPIEILSQLAELQIDTLVAVPPLAIPNAPDVAASNAADCKSVAAIAVPEIFRFPVCGLPGVEPCN
jgi:hypothetical protein